MLTGLDAIETQRNTWLIWRHRTTFNNVIDNRILTKKLLIFQKDHLQREILHGSFYAMNDRGMQNSGSKRQLGLHAMDKFWFFFFFYIWFNGATEGGCYSATHVFGLRASMDEPFAHRTIDWDLLYIFLLIFRSVLMSGVSVVVCICVYEVWTVRVVVVPGCGSNYAHQM